MGGEAECWPSTRCYIQATVWRVAIHNSSFGSRVFNMMYPKYRHCGYFPWIHGKLICQGNFRHGQASHPTGQSLFMTIFHYHLGGLVVRHWWSHDNIFSHEFVFKNSFKMGTTNWTPYFAIHFLNCDALSLLTIMLVSLQFLSLTVSRELKKLLIFKKLLMLVIYWRLILKNYL